MISNISRTASLTELTSNPKSFFNCPDLHGGVPSLPRARIRSGEIRLPAATRKHKALQKSKRRRGAKTAEGGLALSSVGTLERTKSMISAAMRVWELKRGVRS